MLTLVTLLLVQVDDAFKVYQAAIEATAAGQYDRAATLLDQMAEKGATWVAEAGQKKAAQVRRLAKTPDDVAYRIEFASAFWVENVPALGQHYEQARALLLDTLRLKPTDPQQLQIHNLIVRWSLALDDVKSAEEHARLLTRVVGHGMGDEPLLDIAVHQIGKKRYAEARDLLVKLLRAEKPQRWTSRARLALADAYAGLKDEASQLAQLEEVAKTAPEGPFEFNRETALLRIARHFQQKGEYNKALDYFTRYTPKSDCKTCLMGMQEGRQLARVDCLLHLNRHADAVNLCVETLEQPGYTPAVAVTLFRLYREAGQLDDLTKRVKGSAKLREHETVKDLMRIQELAAKKDIDALIRLCQDSGWVSTDVATHGPSDWRCMAAAEALATCLGNDLAPVRDAIRAHQKNVSWLIYALGRTPSAAARELLEELARKERNHETLNVEYALRLRKGEVQPRPKPGSLPRS